MAFEYPVTVRFQHCDPAGIVFYPRYFEMVNACVEIWFEQRLGISFAVLHGQHRLGIPTVSIDSNFVKASRLEDRLTLHLKVNKLGNKSLHIDIDILADKDLRATFQLTLVLVELATITPVAWQDRPLLMAALKQDL